MEGLSEIERVQMFNHELMKILEEEAAEEEKKKQQVIAYIVKHSKTKKASLKNLSLKQLEQRIKLLKDKLRINQENFRRNQVVQELVDAGYGSKHQVGRWKDADLYDTYKKFKALQKDKPEMFQSSSAIVKTKTPQPSKPLAKRSKQTSPKPKTQFRMLIQEKGHILDDVELEEKPIILEGRDPNTYAYQLVTTTTDPHQTQVTTEEHIPGEGRFITITAEQRPL